MKYLSITEAADKMCCSRQYVHECIQKGKMKAKRIGHMWIIADDEVPEYQSPTNEEEVINEESK